MQNNNQSHEQNIGSEEEEQAQSINQDNNNENIQNKSVANMLEDTDQQVNGNLDAAQFDNSMDVEESPSPPPQLSKRDVASHHHLGPASSTATSPSDYQWKDTRMFHQLYTFSLFCVYFYFLLQFICKIFLYSSIKNGQKCIKCYSFQQFNSFNLRVRHLWITDLK